MKLQQLKAQYCTKACAAQFITSYLAGGIVGLLGMVMADALGVPLWRGFVFAAVMMAVYIVERRYVDAIRKELDALKAALAALQT